MEGETGMSRPPVGSFSAGKMSLPQIDHAATAVTMPVKARNVLCNLICVLAHEDS